MYLFFLRLGFSRPGCAARSVWDLIDRRELERPVLSVLGLMALAQSSLRFNGVVNSATVLGHVSMVIGEGLFWERIIACYQPTNSLFFVVGMIPLV